MGIVLNELQRKAVEMVTSNRVSIITGGPGTGKTTCLKEAIRALGGVSVAVLAPTGKAAKRASEVTGIEASTIHRFVGKAKADANKGNVSIPAVVVVDECSMVDITLFASLMSILKTYGNRTRIIIVGDTDQLPSIGAGRVLGDLLEIVPSVRLTQVMRQANDSRIIENAIAINEGRGEDCINGCDFTIINNDDPEFLIERLLDAVADGVASGLDIYTDIQVLVGQRNSLLGAESLNNAIRDVYNPHEKGKDEMFDRDGKCIFRVGDKVINTENDYELGVVNGDQGIVTAIETKNSVTTVTVKIDGREVDFNGESLKALLQSWAMTVHRSQGSEYPLVITVFHTKLMAWAIQRELLYTAVTRGKKKVVVLSDSQAIEKSSKAPCPDRYTRLSSLIRNKLS